MSTTARASLARGVCPECLEDQAVLPNGRVRGHHRCPGGGQLPQEMRSLEPIRVSPPPPPSRMTSRGREKVWREDRTRRRAESPHPDPEQCGDVYDATCRCNISIDVLHPYHRCWCGRTWVEVVARPSRQVSVRQV